MHNPFIRVIALGAFAILCAAPARVDAAKPAAKLNAGAFIAACIADPNVAEQPGFEAGGKVTPKAYCECVAAELEKNKLSQKDVDMLTKMHKEELSDADAESYPTLEDLMVANEGYEDSCKKSLGLPTGGTDVIEVPIEEDALPDAEEVPEEGAPPAEDDGSPPE